MPIEHILDKLNTNQRIAATFSGMHALVLAGAGSGKTRTIIARAGYLIHSGVPADRIQILTFTRRSAKEIVERVKVGIGDRASGLSASTFHTWCMGLIRRLPKLFGCIGHTVIDRDDQLYLFKLLRGNSKEEKLPKAAALCDIYSYARNTRSSLTVTLERNYHDLLPIKSRIADIIVGFESKKRERRYLDYDDILDVVATVVRDDSEVRSYVCQLYDHLLVDEMQDTNPLQWDILKPLSDKVKLFCVGDDAQSIYGFRGADFRNVHSFTERLSDSVVLRLDENYRSTQEILDLSNWLLAQSSIKYNKHLKAIRGSGNKPRLLDFSSEWEEGRWIVEDIVRRHNEGAEWSRHMILARSGFQARPVETCLIAKGVPYIMIGGTKLLESAHIRDVLSLLRIVANPLDELAWMRYLTLWPGVGDVSASRVIDSFPADGALSEFSAVLARDNKLPRDCKSSFDKVAEVAQYVQKAYFQAREALSPLLEHSYALDWDRRKGDLALVEQLVGKHTSILSFIEEYLLDPIHGSAISQIENKDAVTVITIHSAKGTEKPTCYVVNVSPGSYPIAYAADSDDDVEEERRVLYVALTRAQDELILTRHNYVTWASQKESSHIDDPACLKILKTLKKLRREEAKLEVILSTGPRRKTKSKRIITLEEQKVAIQLEINGKKQQLKSSIEAINAASVDASKDENAATYFLNELPLDLVIKEAPSSSAFGKIDASNLTTRQRPDVGIDLS